MSCRHNRPVSIAVLAVLIFAPVQAQAHNSGTNAPPSVPAMPFDPASAPTPGLTKDQLQSLIKLNDQYGSVQPLRTRIMNFFDLSTDTVDDYKARRVGYDCKEGFTIGFIQLHNSNDGYIFTKMQEGVVSLYHVDGDLKLIRAMKMSLEVPTTLRPTGIPTKKAGMELAAIFAEWVAVINNTQKAAGNH